LNICHFSGRLTADCTQRYTQSGTPVSNFTLAVETGYGDYKRTEFIKCVLWKRENLVQYLTKGKPVVVTAELQERKWQDQNGNNRYTTEFVVQNLEFQVGQGKQGDNQRQGQTEPQDNMPDDNMGPAFPSEAEGVDEAPF